MLDDLIALGRRQGYVTYADINRAMPQDAVIEAWVAALYDAKIEIEDDPEPPRIYDTERIESARRTGRALGPMFAQNLLDLAASETPLSFPCGGVHILTNETDYRAVHFPGGPTLDMIPWLSSPTRKDAALIMFEWSGEVIAIALQACGGTSDEDLRLRYRVSRADNRVSTSEPRVRLSRVREDVLDAFLLGLHEGIARHPRANEIAFGALGGFQTPPSHWRE
jgi:hypothetical protein